MAEQQHTISAPFPAPPPFYKHFTKQNLAELRQVRKDASTSRPPPDDTNGSTDQDLDILALPPDLRYLIPPLPPADNQYRSFGSTLNLSAPEATLSDSGIEQLYPEKAHENPSPHLIALTRSLLTTFLSLVGVLSQNPTEYYEERVESLQTIMFNIHDLINRYRPHQARESLVGMMEERVQSMRQEIGRVREARGKVESVLQGLREDGERAGVVERTVGRGDGMDEVKGGNLGEEKRQRKAWAAIEREMGEPS